MSNRVNRASKSMVKLIIGVVVIIVVTIAILQGLGWISTSIATANRY